MTESKQGIDLGQFEAILFDFDGVLADSMHVKTDAFKALFERFSDDIAEKVVKHHIEHGGISRYEKIRYYYEHFLDTKIDEKMVNEIADEFSRLVVGKVLKSPWITGVKEVLDRYYEEVDMYVVSGTPQEELEMIIEKRNMAKYFKKVYGSPETKPEITKRIIDHNGYNKKKVLFIGDSLSDYRAAKETDIQFLGVVNNPAENPFPEKTTVINNFSCF